MFTHLHTHSDYSFLDSLPKVGELAKKAKELGQEYIALTDRSNMHGAIEFYKECKSIGIKPILGCEMFIAPRSRFDKEAGVDSKRERIVLLAENNEGYENLLQLVTLAFSEGFYYIPRIDKESLQKFSKNIIAIIPRNQGIITPYLETGDLDQAKEKIEIYQEIFSSENLFIETCPRPNAENERIYQKNFNEFIAKNNLNGVATNDIRYLEAEDNEIHDTLICMQYSLQKHDADRISFREHDLSFWTEEQMNNYFSEHLEYVSNSGKIAKRCSYEFTFGVNLIPEWEVPKNFDSEFHLLQFLCEEGVRKRYGGKYRGKPLGDENFNQSMEEVDNSPVRRDETTLNEEEYKEVMDRLTFELKIINDMGFNAYFIIVGDFVQWAKNHDIPVGPGRGSAAGAIVAYLLEITDLDPLKYGLLFERFLNPERVSMPDIDIDFADTGLARVIQYVTDKYGKEQVARVCTFGTMAARAAIKDVARTYALPFSEANEFVKLINDKPGTKLQSAFDESTELQEALEKNEEWNEIWKAAIKLEGNIRHVSVHACAVMITPKPIIGYCPMQPAPKNDEILITQFQAKPLEMLGLLKMDFLGLRNLSIMENAIKIIKNRHGIEINLSTIPMDDEAAFKLLTDGLTTGVFQLESAGMTRYLKELKPSQFEDIIAMVSLYRPGPMKFIPDYIGGKHGTKKVKYPHPSLENVLKETFGIAIYQEQILEIAKVFGGFTLGGADLLRRAIGKKIASEMEAQRTKFIEGAQNLGHKKELAEHIYDEVIVPFAGYGFNKSHAACYAMIAYQTAYLKSRYPIEFMNALLISDAENTDRVILDIEECRNLGINVLPPSVEESDFSFSVIDDNTIRFGLNAIKGIGDSVVQGLIDAKNGSNGKFENFADFLEKCGPKVINKKSLEALAKAGALKRLERTENILENVEKVLQFTKDTKTQVSAGQDDLFGSFGVEVESASLDLGDEPEYSFAHILLLEKKVLGMYVSGHPLQGMKPYFNKTRTPIKRLPSAIRRSPKKIGKTQGLLTFVKRLITKKGDAMAIACIEDLSGKLDLVFFPKSYAKLSECLEGDAFLKVEGSMEKREGEWQMMVDKCERFELEEVRIEAEKKGLIDENEEGSILDLEENIANEHIVHDQENEMIEEFIDSESKTKVWDIFLPSDISPLKIKELKTVLADSKGDTEVIIHFKGNPIPYSHPIEKNEILIKAVNEIVG